VSKSLSEVGQGVKLGGIRGDSPNKTYWRYPGTVSMLADLSFKIRGGANLKRKTWWSFEEKRVGAGSSLAKYSKRVHLVKVRLGGRCKASLRGKTRPVWKGSHKV